MSAAARAGIALALILNALPPLVSKADAAGYATAEQAFEVVFIASGISELGYEENREYAAALYQMPDGLWHATPVVAGNVTTSSIPYHLVPPQAVRIAGAHTHGQPRLPEDPTHVYGTDFSQTDRRNAIRAYQASHGRIDSQLLLTSQLAVLRMSIGPRYDETTASIALTTDTIRLTSLGDPRVRY